MSNNRKMKSEKEVNALALNQKEDRLLARTFRTLELENGYSTNLLTLNYRTIKGNYKNLKDRVSKIKSNLAPEEIIELRQLESDGKLKPMINTFNLNAAMKIAAAARRLKLYPDSVRRSRSAHHSRRSQRSDTSKLLAGRSTENSHHVNYERSNSVTGVFMDAPPPDFTRRRNSLEGAMTTIRPFSASNMTHEDERGRELKSRPSTTSGVDREKTNLSKVSFKHNNGYSSHTAAEKEQSMLTSSKTPRDQKTSFLTDDLMENNLGTDIYEERRQELLNEEHMFYNHLQSRKNAFLGKVDDYLKENPPVTFEVKPVLKTPVHIDGEASESEDETNGESDISKSHSRRRRFRRDFDFSRTFTSEEAYAQRGNELWKDMNKTRYLRLPDEKLDLSGVVTLAKDQMKLFQLLRSSEPAHLIQ